MLSSIKSSDFPTPSISTKKGESMLSITGQDYSESSHRKFTGSHQSQKSRNCIVSLPLDCQPHHSFLLTSEANHSRMVAANPNLFKQTIYVRENSSYHKAIPSIIAALTITAIVIPLIVYYNLNKECSVKDDFPNIRKISEIDPSVCENIVIGDVVKDIHDISLDQLKQHCMELEALGVSKEELANTLTGLYDEKFEQLDHANSINSGWINQVLNFAIPQHSSIGICSNKQVFNRTVLKNDFRECMPGVSNMDVLLGNFPSDADPIIKKMLAPLRTIDLSEFLHKISYTNTANKVHMWLSTKMIEEIRNGYFSTSPVEVAAFLTGHSIETLRSAISESNL